MRTVKPRGGGFACMHVKSWILDEEVVLTGSTNLTHNGLENNKEHLFVISESSAVSSVMSDFEREWEAADVVTPERLVAMKETWDKQYASGQRSRSASSSVVRGRSEPVLRSLTEELDAAGNE
jgi:phosphatidylserine/phosphatidylglycerophosphate/cardiolipin synthase-like enzyme